MPSVQTNPSVLNPMLSGSRFSLFDEAGGFLTNLWGPAIPDGYEDETGFHFSPLRPNAVQDSAETHHWLGEHI